MTTYKEIRILGVFALHQLCIKNNWYTCGNNAQYINLLKKAKKSDIKTEDIVELATDIYNHSDNSEYEITDIMFEISEECSSIFIKNK